MIAAEVADNVTDVLRGVLTDGTAAGRGIDRPAAGKTGTAQDNGNAWFVGFTPTLSTAVWMGYLDLQRRPLRRASAASAQVTGGSLPARTWQAFMNAALDGVPVTEFTEPAPIPDVRDEALRERARRLRPRPAPLRRRDGLGGRRLRRGRRRPASTPRRRRRSTATRVDDHRRRPRSRGATTVDDAVLEPDAVCTGSRDSRRSVARRRGASPSGQG